MAEDAVVGELVSAYQIPASREKNRDLSIF
jgi:hypothetical protein